MANIGASLEKLITGASKQLGKFQIATNKILWGSANTQPIHTAKYDPKTGKTAYIVTPTQAATPKTGNLIESGLFNALDALNQVDLCSVVTYTTTNINVKKKKRPEKPWSATQTAFYALQDQAFITQVAIDKYTAFPNVFIGSYVGVGPNAISAKQAIDKAGTPVGQDQISGTDVQKYNMYNLLQTIKEAFAVGDQATGASIFTAEDRTLITSVPGLGGNLNMIDDFIGGINQYADYRNISNNDLRNLQTKISTIRSVCVTIQTLEIKSVVALVGNFLGTDIRAQIQKLSEFLDPTKIIPTLKQINSAIQSFINIAQKIQGILNQAQFVIKLALLFIKVFKFIQAFLIVLPLPSLFTTSGIQVAYGKAFQAAQDSNKTLVKLLKEINSLLSVVVLFVRYLLANANELAIRLQTLLATLEACEALKDSDVLAELQQTSANLKALQDQLAQYIIQYDSKTTPETAMFGKYDIRVVDEEVTDTAILNKRRRGIALDIDGAIVVQSDLTFATNTTVIIDEVKLKLMAKGLVQPSLGTMNGSDLAVISTSLDYLDSNDVMQEDLNLSATAEEDPNNLDENKGIGLNAFINNLSGGKRLRKRVRAALDSSTQNLKTQMATEGTNSTNTLNTANNVARSVG